LEKPPSGAAFFFSEIATESPRRNNFVQGHLVDWPWNALGGATPRKPWVHSESLYRKFESLSLRHPPERPGFCVDGQAENPEQKRGFRGSWLYWRLPIFGAIGLEKAFFSKASYFVRLVRFRKVKRQRHNLKSKSASVRVSVGRARVTESLD
jgi:hypothetical protein